MVPDEAKTESLLKFFLRSASMRKSLLVADMKLLGQFLDIPDFPTKSLRNDLLLALVNYAANGDSEYVEQIEIDMQKPEKPKVIGDPLDEFVFGELPGEDQGDYREVAKEVETRKKMAGPWLSRNGRQ